MVSATDTTTFLIYWFDPGGIYRHAPPAYAARGLKGTLSPIDAAKGNDKLARTVNGTLIDISAPQMRKYRLEINGSDQDPPSFDGLWVGMEVGVSAMVEIGRNTDSGAPAYEPVPGSVRYEGNWTYYSPLFLGRVVDLQIERDEWAAQVTWSLTVEEI